MNIISRIAIAALVAAPAFLSAAMPSQATGASAVAKCYDRVIAACNKKSSDAAVNACVKSGLDQCDTLASSSGSSNNQSTGNVSGLRTSGGLAN
jgi:hypothetical protein